MTKAQLQTIADLVAIAHDQYDGCSSHRDDLECFDRLLAEIKAEAQSATGNAAAKTAAEPLSAILAEMRDRADTVIDGRVITERNLVPQEAVEDWADRIEAAAEREREEDRQLAAIAESDEAFARCARCDRPERATGNVAELREALIYVRDLMRRVKDGDRISSLAFLGVVEHALAAPARNCDRFATAEDAMEEWNKYPQSRYKGCRVCPHGDASMISPAHLTLAEWLFAQAEGGGHA